MKRMKIMLECTACGKTYPMGTDHTIIACIQHLREKMEEMKEEIKDVRDFMNRGNN